MWCPTLKILSSYKQRHFFQKYVNDMHVLKLTNHPLFYVLLFAFLLSAGYVCPKCLKLLGTINE